MAAGPGAAAALMLCSHDFMVPATAAGSTSALRGQPNSEVAGALEISRASARDPATAGDAKAKPPAMQQADTDLSLNLAGDSHVDDHIDTLMLAAAQGELSASYSVGDGGERNDFLAYLRSATLRVSSVPRPHHMPA